MDNLRRSSFAQRTQPTVGASKRERKVKKGSYLTHPIYRMGMPLYTYKYLNFFATFASLREQLSFLG